MRMHKRGVALGTALVLTAAVATGATWPHTANGAPAADTHGRAPLSSNDRAPKSFADIFAQVSPAVVSIDVERKVERSNADFGLSPFSGAAPFGLPFSFSVPNQRSNPPPTEAKATGSGFFISPDGYIVTNNHVVEDATSITVRLTDGRELKAKLVGRDAGSDLAVVKVEGAKFPFVQFETDAIPRVGDWVMAVGNPFNLGGTATVGIVSAHGRDIGEQFIDYLQIDAPINRGNSGGPTFDVYGRVVGVNTAIFSPSGGSVGIGFAVPADLAAQVTRQLIDEGHVTRGYLGITIQSVTQDIASGLGLKAPKGALVSSVNPGGPAAKGGVKVGDVVVGVDGKDVASANDLTHLVAAAAPNQELHLQVQRDGGRQTLTIRAGERPPENQLASNDLGGAASPDAEAGAVLGMKLTPVDPDLRRRLRLGDEVNGLAVTGVDTGSEAGRQGVRPGDVIVRAGQRSVASTDDVEAAVQAMRTAKRGSVLLLVNRRGQNVFIAVPLDGKETGAG